MFENPYPHQIEIRSAAGSASNKNQDPYPHRSDFKPDPDPHQFADDKPKCMEFEPI
jgi:hypothetical protein